MIKITKQQLLDAIPELSCKDYRGIIKGNWPKYRKKLSLSEFIEVARGAKICEFDIQWVLWNFDLAGWKKTVQGSVSVNDKRIADNYLNE